MSSGSPIRTPIALVAAALSLLALLATAATATAGSYVAVDCNPTYNPTSAALYQEGGATPANMKELRHCFGGGQGLQLYEEGQSTGNGSWNSHSWFAPPGGYFSQLYFEFNLQNDNGFWPFFLYTPHPSGSNLSYESSIFRNSNWYARTVQLGAASAWHDFLTCYGTPCTAGNGHNHVRNLWFTIQDPSVPSLSLGGPLLAGGTRHGAEVLNVAAGDSPAGIARIGTTVNGTPVPAASADYVSGNVCNQIAGAAKTFNPCPGSVSPSFVLQTDAPPWRNGSNALSVCASDFGGEVACESHVVQVDNTCPASAGDPAGDLDGGIEQRGALRDAAIVRSTDDPVLRGKLTTLGGQPVDGATVCVFETVDLPDASPELAATLRTRPNGNFATRLDAGPSRAVDLVYRYNDRVLEDGLTVSSTAVPTLKVGPPALKNGSVARFHGALPGPNADYRAVALQARAGRKWRTFKQIHTDSNGLFRGIYRFTQTRSTARYTFRALVKRQGGYPFEPGRSRLRKVLVRG